MGSIHNIHISIPGNPKVVKCVYSADLSSKNVFVEAKTYLYVENVFFALGARCDLKR